MKNPIVESRDYTLYIEPFNGFLFIHADVYRWNKSVKRLLSASFESLKNAVKTRLFALVLVENTKNRKFVDLFKFYPIKTITGTDGKEWVIYGN